MQDIADSVHEWRRSSQAALWLTEDCDANSAGDLVEIGWARVWSAVSPQALEQSNSERNSRLQFLHSRNEVPMEGAHRGIQFIYNTSREVVGAETADLRRRRAEEMENIVEGWRGAIVVIGKLSDQLAELFRSLAPTAQIFVIDSDDAESRASLVQDFLKILQSLENLVADEDALALKGTPNLQIDAEYMEPLSHSWEIITKGILNSGGKVTQEDFDNFLSGQRGWECISAGAVFPREKLLRSENDAELDLVSEVVKSARSLDEQEVDPSEAVIRFRLFCEPGAGCTTLLKQAAIKLARAGYPVLISRPHPHNLRPQDVIRLVIAVQDTWASQREGKGSGSGTLPFCVILDSDAELPAQAESFVRTLSTGLNRKLLFISAHTRSREEIDSSKGALKLYANTSEEEILALGDHLRDFCNRNGLLPVPTTNEWKVFFQNFGPLKTHSPLAVGGIISTPALFLIGLYPFVKERVRDQRGLSRYLYEKWSEVEDDGLKKVIQMLAAASVYNCAVPLDCAIRDAEIEGALAQGKLTKQDARIGDFFFDWARFGVYKFNWAIHMRHPAMGSLLLRLLIPEEAIAPHSYLSSILIKMTGSEADVWFSEQIAFKLGKFFRSSSASFSLESDTPIQLAAREIFDAIPEYVSCQSRVIKHHHARYYIHLLHACLEVLQSPEKTIVSKVVALASAESSLKYAAEILEQASEIKSERDSLSNIKNSLAAATARLAEGYIGSDQESALSHFEQAIAIASEAVDEDIANGHAHFTLVSCIQKMFSTIGLSVVLPEKAISLFVTCEDHINILLDLKDSKKWRNVDESSSELGLAQLLERHNVLADELNQSSITRELIAKTPGAQATIQLRKILGGESIKEGFQNRRKANDLRELRDRLVNEEFFHELLDLRYRLFLGDPVGRFDFEARLNILTQMAQRSPDEYVGYLHDHAAVAFQLEQFELSTVLFRDLRARQSSNPNQWFWHNERIYLERQDSEIAAKEVVVRVTDPVEGWARYDDRVRLKIQPRQWGQLNVGDYLRVYLRFRIAGLQGVDKRLANYDLEQIGLPAMIDGAKQ
ncbi:hypothetical protein [Roseibium aggregatum]|uniref:hypothetical protein n=1 Tax=Roseibium aggregatum TaxID=187304 RepID=UPI00095F43DB|nr:hypothetical protein [Roseibium aggregatum]UFI03124.1 hypothetical protein ST40_024425 [Roseibium aggregatum]